MSLNTILATAPLTTTNYILKATGTTIGNSLIWDNGTNVGIGNTNTSYTLDVSGSGRYNGNYAGHLLNVQNTNASYYSSTDYYDNAGTEKLIVGYGNASTGNALASKAIIYGTSGVGLNFYTNGSTTAKMVIDTSGNVGIGTSSPTSSLFIAGNQSQTSLTYNAYASLVINSQVNGGGGPNMVFGTTDTGGPYSYIQVRNPVSSGYAYPLVLQGSGGNVGIGTTNPSYKLVVSNNGADGLEIIPGTNPSGVVNLLAFNRSGGTYSDMRFDGNNLIFYTNGVGERMRITSGGEVLMHSTTFSSLNAGQYFGTGGDTYFTTDTSQVLYINRKGNDGTLVDFRRDNSVKGTISVSGETVSYNSFLGSHWSQLQDGSKTEILKGTIIEAIDEMCVWQDETNDRLPKSKISDSLESKNVYGTFLAWDEDWETSNDFYVAAVGLGYIRVNSSQNISMGDLLQSNGDGTAKIQSDDIMRSSTIAKVVSTQKIETYEDGSYLIAATLHCG